MARQTYLEVWLSYSCNETLGNVYRVALLSLLEKSYRDPKSFMIYWDRQFGHLVVRLVIARVLVSLGLRTLNDYFRSKVQEDDIRIHYNNSISSGRVILG